MNPEVQQCETMEDNLECRRPPIEQNHGDENKSELTFCGILLPSALALPRVEVLGLPDSFDFAPLLLLAAVLTPFAFALAAEFGFPLF
jgi:hypothetical protein